MNAVRQLFHYTDGANRGHAIPIVLRRTCSSFTFSFRAIDAFTAGLTTWELIEILEDCREDGRIKAPRDWEVGCAKR